MTGFRLPPAKSAADLIDRNQPIGFRFDGRQYSGYRGDTLASALLGSGVRLFGRSFKYHRPRGVWGLGCEEPNALVELGTGARREPNIRATEVEIFDGLTAQSQNRWPSLRFDALAVNGLLSPMFVAGFYYKTFMWPAKFWEKLYEPMIRRAAGLGRAPDGPDPDTYDRADLHCDILIIGAGPAGLAAALTAAASGLRVVLAEADFMPGGRLLSNVETVDGQPATDWVAQTVTALRSYPNVTLLTRTTVFGAFDHGTYAALQRLTDHQQSGATRPRQCCWTLHAKRSILATGALEQPIAFGNNDRPGIMSASALRGYLNRYRVACGAAPAIFTANDDGWRTATDLLAAGVQVAAVVDVRADVDLALRAQLRDTPTFLGAKIVNTKGPHALCSIDILQQNQTVTRIKSDALGVSGGWNPTLHLSSHTGHRPEWSADLGCFVPGQLPADMTVTGAARGIWALADCLTNGQDVAQQICAGLGKTVHTPHRIAACASHTAATTFWHVTESRAKAFVDLQHDVTTNDIRIAAQEGFVSVEHLKRYTTLGMGTDQGKSSNLAGLGILSTLTGKDIAAVGTTVFRPPYTPVALGAIAGHAKGTDLKPTRLTPSHDWAKANGASFVEAGLWLRAQWYQRPGEAGWRDSVDREAITVRASVGVCDVSTLGKIEVFGPDAAEFLDFIYTNTLSTVAVGRIRYGVMLREDGFVFDDGTVARLGPERFFITTTTANAAAVLLHLEFCHQVHMPHLHLTCVSVTDQWAQFSIAGPRARDVVTALAVDAAGLSNAELPHMAWRYLTLLGDMSARLYRLSFSGELAYELAVPAPLGDALIRQIISAGAPFGIAPYGLEALATLRIEKGHVAGSELNGQVTATDLGLGGLLSTKKEFIGRRLAARAGLTDPDRPTLVGLLSLEARAGFKPGGHLFGEHAPRTFETDLGHVTSTCFSPAMNAEIGLALLMGGAARNGEILIAHDPMRARDTRVQVCPPVFVDPTEARTKQ